MVDCSTASIYQVLKQAQQIGMVTRYYHFFFTNLVSQGNTLLTDLWLAGYKRLCSVNPAQTTPDITPWPAQCSAYRPAPVTPPCRQDLHTVDLHDFQYAGTNITGLRLVNSDQLDVIRRVESWKEMEAARGRRLADISASRLSVSRLRFCWSQNGRY